MSGISTRQHKYNIYVTIYKWHLHFNVSFQIMFSFCPLFLGVFKCLNHEMVLSDLQLLFKFELNLL